MNYQKRLFDPETLEYLLPQQRDLTLEPPQRLQPEEIRQLQIDIGEVDFAMKIKKVS